MIKNKSLKVLVMGATGMLGRAVYKYLQDKHRKTVFGTTRKKTKKDLIYLKIGEIQLDDIFQDNHFDYVVNCIGALRGSSKEDLLLLNINFSKELLKLSEKYNFGIINISSDAVFEDNAGKINEDSIPKPQDLYGKSKLEGELSKNTINIRTSILGLDPEEHKGILEFVLQNKNKKMQGFTNQNWSGATALQLAKFIEWIIFENRFDRILKQTNIIHFPPIRKTTKYEILRTFSKIIEQDNIVKGEGKKISRILSTKYFDEINLKMYTKELEKTLRELIKFDNGYVEKIRKS